MFAILSAILLAKLHAQSHFGTYETSFDTDFFFPLRVPLEKVKFWGSPHFYNNGTPWINSPDEAAPWPENVRYVGEPSHELDENWQRLIGKRYFSISDEEAEKIWGDRRHEYVDQNMGGYTAGFDVFHTLHCINELRKALRPDYYPPKSHTLHGALHNGTPRSVALTISMLRKHNSDTYKIHGGS
ncbi:Tat pathway signal sequence [Fusarium beomiforme]|uniref:Tat pathway signal sequence n=1 Tax=Fusarium beomiforme TaxID=44412 RepID=A0A9P5DUP9_9HYPO|nr:Tat pathway signal sequence [Fusarium beomiforme]